MLLCPPRADAPTISGSAASVASFSFAKLVFSQALRSVSSGKGFDVLVNDPFDYSTVRTVTTGLRFPEGPIALDDGSVLVSEIEGGALNRVLPDGSQHPIDCGGGANGAALGPDGAVYVCNDGGLGFKTEDGIRFPHTSAEGNVGGYVQRVDIDDAGPVETVFTHVDDEHLGGLNDIVFDFTGSCYIVDTGRGAVHYADPVAGTIRCIERDLSLPNGMGLSPDGNRLYLTETYTGNVFTWDVVGPGNLAGKRLLFNDGGEHGWDGLAVDGAGNVCAVEPQGVGRLGHQRRRRRDRPVRDPRARPLRDEHLLWRARRRHRLHLLLGSRDPLLGAMALGRPAPELRPVAHTFGSMHHGAPR